MSILGILASLLLAAVQASREMARRAHCSNNLRNQALALHNMHSALQRFPAGRRVTKSAEYSWCVETLPYLEQGALLAQIDRTKPWNDPVNTATADTSLPIFRCPSAVLKFPGKIDYGGIVGSMLANLSPAAFGLDNGVMIEVGRERQHSIRLSDITDGSSQTFLISECSDREADAGGRWVSGFNCFSQDNGGINATKGAESFSYHRGGAFVAFADGKVQFVSSHTPKHVIGALCSRCGGEVVADW